MVSDCDGAGIAAVQGEEEEEIRTYTVTLHYTHDTGDISDTPITYCSGHALHILWLCRIASYPLSIAQNIMLSRCMHVPLCKLVCSGKLHDKVFCSYHILQFNSKSISYFLFLFPSSSSSSWHVHDSWQDLEQNLSPQCLQDDNGTLSRHSSPAHIIVSDCGVRNWGLCSSSDSTSDQTSRKHNVLSNRQRVRSNSTKPQYVQ
jgi:hypothetical protein